MSTAKSKIKDFTQGSIASQLITFAFPLFLSNLLQVVYNMVDMIVVGNVLGKEGLSAVSVGGDVTNLLTFISMGFASAGQVLIARFIGGRQEEKIGKFVGTMCGFLFSCALILTVLGLSFQPAMLQLMNTPPESLEGAQHYATVCMAGLVFIYGYNIVSAILRGMGDSRHPFIFISLAAVMNLVLDIVFVIGFKMGAGGAALATVISQGTSFFLCAHFLIRHREAYKLNIRPRDFVRWDQGMLLSLIKLGVPMAIKSASIMVSKLFVNSFINAYGVAVSAFAGIAAKLASVSMLVSNAMNTAGSTVVGQNLAAGKFDRVKKILLHIAWITLSMASLFSLVLALFPEKVFGIFTADAAVMQIARGYIPIAVLLFFGAAMRAIMNALINGSGHTKINFATAILDGIVMRIGLAVLFGLVMHMEYTGFWLGDALAGFTPFFIGLVFYLTGTWKKQSLREK